MPKVFIRNYLIFTALLFACVGSMAYLLITGDRQIDKSDNWVLHTHKVIVEAEKLNSLISEMLASQRGYILSGDERFMQEYKKRKTAVSRTIANLSDLIDGNPSQATRLAELREYFTSFAQQLEARASDIDNESIKEVLKDTELINTLRDDIARVNADFLSAERTLLKRRVKLVETKKNQYLWTLLVGTGVAVALLMIFNGYLLNVQSKRSAAETALNEREEVFRLAVEGTQDGIFDWDMKTGDVYYSTQYISMLGYEPEDFKGNFEDFESKLHEEEKKQVLEYVDLYLQGQLSEYSNTFRMRHKSGRWLWINARGKIVLDKNNKPIRMVGSHTDISTSKEYEMRLQEAKSKAEAANRAKTDFLAHMSHEIRTPLTTISGAAEILQQGKNDLDEKKQKLISVLNASSTVLKDLISDILDFSKIESGELDLEETVFDLEEAFQHIVSIMAVRATEQGLDFKFDYEDVKQTHLYSDPIRLRQILINLIGNAIKFTEEGHVHAKAYSDTYNGADVLRIDIEDTGIGISEDHFDLVFERFKQADATVSRKYGGTGLGLPISKKLADLMGGDIQLKSKKGEGSTFSLILPFKHVQGSEEEQKQNQARKNKINDKLKSAINDKDKVLLVEDYEGNIVVLGYILEDMEIEYDVAKTGLEALNLWKENHYDLVLMDIQMPEMDGFTATEQIRNIEDEQDLERTPIIGMTAHALVGDKDKCIAAGMDDYLPKPINETDLKKSMLKFLKLRQHAA